MNETKESLQDEVVAALLEQKEHHHSALLIIHRRLNELRPVSSLPLEVLQAIFMLYIECAFDDWDDPNIVIHALLDLTHVCVAWRAAAIGFPQLWFPVPFIREEKITELVLQRGGSSPLRARFRYRSRQHTPSSLFYVSSLLKPHSDRIQAVQFTTTHQPMFQFFDMMGPNLPNLTTLELSHDRSEGDDDEALWHLFEYKPAPVIDVVAPNLQHLHLHHCLLLSFAHCADLVHLSLSDLIQPLPLSTVVSLLSDSPRLQHLILDNVNFHGTPIHPQEIPLSDLRYIRSSGGGRFPTLLAAVLPSTGPRTRVAIFDRECLSPPSACNAVSQHLWLLNSSHEIECRQNKLSLEFRPTAYPEAWLTLRPFRPTNWSSLLPREMDFSRITTLSISAYTRDCMGTIPEIPFLPSLKRLALHGASSKVFFGHLLHHAPSHQPYFKLEELRLTESWDNSNLKSWLENGRIPLISAYVGDLSDGDTEEFRSQFDFAEELRVILLEDGNWADW